MTNTTNTDARIARVERILRGLRADLAIALRGRDYIDRAHASGRAATHDFLFALAESNTAIDKLETAIARYSVTLASL